jgi:predicted transcriptional regulator
MPKKQDLPALSRRERQVMDILHRRGGATVAEIMADLPDPPTYSAVRSVLRILGEKELIRHKEDGPRYVYHPTEATERTRDDVLAHVVRT